MNIIHQEVKALLEAFGYKPEITEDPKYNITDLHFPVDGGFEAVPVRHKDAVIMLTKGYLSELYYAHGIQHVYLYNERKGLNPDDDRYSCLLHEMRLVDSESPQYTKGEEIFVNMGDHFKRFVNWQECNSD